MTQTGDDISNDCTNSNSPCRTVQQAVDQAAPSDTILVATGVYSDVHVRSIPPGCPLPPASGTVTQVVYISKTVAVVGGYTTTNWNAPNPEANPTALNAQGQGRVIVIAGEISPTLEGLRITGGDAAQLGGRPTIDDAGGGIYIINATAIISNNQVFENVADWGGGLFLYGDGSTLSGNTVISNVARWNGGGLSLHASGSTLAGNAINANRATGWSGGGLFLQNSRATLESNTIMSNAANGFGGGLVLFFSSALLVNNVTADNQANISGSGLYIYGSSSRLLHNTIARNTGGNDNGMNIIAGGGGNYSRVTLTNTILISHTVGISVTENNTVTINGVLWYDTPITLSQSVTATAIVQNQYEGDPRFAADGHHLTPGSAAIDRGVEAGVVTDIDGQSRPQSLAPDIGADEYREWRIYLLLVLRQ